MDKGKGIAATSQGIGLSAKEQAGEIKSESGSDDERGATTARPPRAVVVDDGASSSTAGGGGGASSSSEPSAPWRIGPFEDGQYVRLRNRGRGGYLFANDNGRGVCVDHRRGMVNTAWAVQILGWRVLLRSAAYGRYLSSTYRLASGFGLVGCYTMQCIFEYPDHSAIEWTPAMGRRGSFLLLQGTCVGTRALRANGRYQRWNSVVTFGPVNLNQISSMMEWEVQAIPMTLRRPPYQPNDAIRLPEVSEEVIDISYCLAWYNDNGSVEHDEWMPMRFRGRSLIRLRDEIAKLAGAPYENVTLFTQAGFLAKPIPLLTDLHLRHDPRMILVFITTNSPAFDALRFPDLAAE